MGDEDSDKENTHPNTTPADFAYPPLLYHRPIALGNSTDATAAGTDGVETPRAGTARSDDGMEEEAGG